VSKEKLISEEEIARAYVLWRGRNRLVDKVQYGSQLKTIRQGLNLSVGAVAERMDIARSTYAEYEESENKGTISLATLKKAAEALECELVCVIRPVSLKACSEIIWEKILPTALGHPWLRKCDPKHKAAALCFIAGKLLNDAKFRKQQGWAQRKS
jgi:transcriptional regulator with XRE-family HTH domain